MVFLWKEPKCCTEWSRFSVEGHLASSGDVLLPSTLLIQKSQVPGFDEILILTPFHLIGSLNVFESFPTHSKPVQPP